MSFPDNPDLLRTPRNFAIHAAAGELTREEVSGQLSNLLGFAKNFYLQFFRFEFDVAIHSLDAAARRAVRPAEKRLRAERGPQSTLRLISQFVTITRFLEDEEATEYDSFDLPDRRRRVLEDIAELLVRIESWSADQSDLPKLAERAREVQALFAEAVEFIDRELGYEDDEQN